MGAAMSDNTLKSDRDQARRMLSMFGDVSRDGFTFQVFKDTPL